MILFYFVLKISHKNQFSKLSGAVWCSGCDKITILSYSNQLFEWTIWHGCFL